MEATSKIYVQLVNPTEDEVNEKIKKGYSPWAVTTRRASITKQGNLVNVADIEVFHMLRRKKKEES